MSTEGAGPIFPPTQFGRYTLLERLAIGGMAEVFRAKIVSSHGFEKTLVIKRILPHLAADKTFVSMFIDEAKLTAQLTHPKIVQILDFGDVGGQYFIALELIDGFDALALLRSCAQKRVRLPLHLSAFIVIELLEALDYAHNARDMDGHPMHLVHRDISPSNIFISKRGDVKLGDFGIAHAQERESKTQAGTLKGKYGYMSPEQVVGLSLDGRSDIFAAGIVLAEMLMGRRLFTASNDLDVLLMVRDGRMSRLEKYGHDIPPELNRIVRRALNKDPDGRFGTAAEFRDALADYVFAVGKRVSAAELRSFVADLFDERPEAQARLTAASRRLAEPVAATRPLPIASVGGGGVRDTSAGPRGGPQVGADLRNSAEAPAGINASVGAQPVRALSDNESTADLRIGAAVAGGSVVKAVPRAVVGDESSAALGRALGQPLAIVDLDQWVHETDSSSVHGTGWTPISKLDSGGGRSPHGGTRSDVGRFVPGAPKRPPDSAGDVSVISPMRVFSDLAVAQETGLLRFELEDQVKEVYLANGSPESVNSSLSGDRFGEYLVTKGALRAADLDHALTMLPQYAGKLGDTLVGLGLMEPLEVFRMLSQQVRDRVIDIFSWTRGTFAFYRNVVNQQDSFPLGLDTFEILGAGVLNLPFELLEDRFASLLDARPAGTGRMRIQPEAFHLGPTPREVLEMLDGERTLRSWMGHFTAPEELLTFLRALYLLVETDLAHFD